MIKDCGQQWWKEAKYGLFIHWGLYSLLAGSYKGRQVEDGISEWIMKRLKISVADYEKIAKEFNPTASRITQGSKNRFTMKKIRIPVSL